MNSIKNVIDHLRSGGLAIIPTDTAVGICCAMSSVASVDFIYSLKGRPTDKPLLVLVDSIEMAKKYVNFDKKTEEFAGQNWPAGITLILPCKTQKIPKNVRANGETLAVRMPASAPLRRIIEEVGVPLVAPSANYSGEKTPYALEEVSEKIFEQVKIVLPGECYYKKESTLIDTTVTPWKVIRQGAVKIENQES